MADTSTTFVLRVGRRYRAARAYKRLTAPWIVSSFTLLFVVAYLGVGAWLFEFSFPVNLLALAAVTASAAGALFLLFTYGATTGPYRLPPMTVAELLQPQTHSINVAQALDYQAVALVGRNQTARDEVDMMRLLTDALGDLAVRNLFDRLQMSVDDFLAAVQELILPTLTTEQLAYTALSQAAVRGRTYLGLLDIVGVFLLHPQLHTYVRQRDLQEQDISNLLWSQQALRDAARSRARWWDPENLLSFTGIGLSWASGYTPLIDRFARVPRGDIWDIPFGHADQVDQLISALARRKQSNVLIVGKPGVGRLGVVREVARRVNTNMAHPALNGLRVVYVHVGQLLALGGSGPEQLSVISQALSEMERAGNIIAVLDGIGSVLGQSGEERLNLSDVLLPFFSSQEIRVVAIMSDEEYHYRVKADEELVHYFEVVPVPALTEEQTLQLLLLTIGEWEEQTRLFVPYRTLREIVRNTSSILPGIPFPEKAFDVLEEAIVVAQARGKRTLAAEDINELISKKIGIDIGQLKAGESERLLHLEEFIHQRVVNQEEAVAAVAHAMIRARAGVRSLKRPIGTFLFLGPTGVGKTETAKALAEAYFGSEEHLQRLDMGELQGQDGVDRLIGGGRYETGSLSRIVNDHPFSVLLLDEFEKADEAVKQLFLPVFDEGYLIDARGEKLSFVHTILIATSNAGAEFIRTRVAKQEGEGEEFNEQLREHILSTGVYKPELLNRFDGVITFRPLSKEHIKEVATLMLGKLNARLDAEHGVTVNITAELVEYLADIGYDPEFGARPMARAIQNSVEYAVAEQIVRGAVQPGQQVTFSPAILTAKYTH